MASSPAEPAPAAPAEPTPAEPAPAPPAWEGSVAVLAIPKNPNATTAAARVETDLRAALGAQADVRLVDLGALFPPPPPASPRQGDALFDEGKGLYDNLDPEAAARKFAEAAAFYERHPAEVKPERLARVYIFLGASRLLNADSAGAQEAFTRAQLTAPTLQPESELFGQDVHDAFNAARVALSHQPRGTLAIDSVPTGAQVVMRGESLGTTPLEDVELAPGPHPVVLTLPGYAPFGVIQQVAPSQRAELRPTLEPTPGLASVRGLAATLSTSRALEVRPTSARCGGNRREARRALRGARPGGAGPPRPDRGRAVRLGRAAQEPPARGGAQPRRAPRAGGRRASRCMASSPASSSPAPRCPSRCRR